MTPLDRFKSWVAEQEAEGLTRTQVAARVGCSEGAISRILNETSGVGGYIAARIEDATRSWVNGPIVAKEWFPPRGAKAKDAA